MTSKDQERIALQAQMDEFLARGGSVTRCPPKMPAVSDGREFAQSRLSVKETKLYGGVAT